jgi:hypothetical protein
VREAGAHSTTPTYTVRRDGPGEGGGRVIGPENAVGEWARRQASERSVCVCEAVSVEKGARHPPLPTAVVCPPGRRRRRLAITAVFVCTGGGTGRHPVFKYRVPHGSQPRPGWAPDPRWTGGWASNNVDLLVSGFCQIYLTVKYI